MSDITSPVALRVRDLVRDVVTEVAPEELPVVEGLLQFDDDTVVRRLRRGNRLREPLGFGLGEIATLVTPALWLVLDEAGRRFAGAAVESAGKRLRAACRALLRRRSKPVTVPLLTREQVADVRHRVLESAVRNGLTRPDAVALADAVAARLFLPEPDGTDGDPADS
ncbi:MULTISPECIES: hypothetical protein [Amycolatopsis]|uniref:Uncharacterized protein n=1 Tax=Amycolatopsis dongchuanensis TaxID=1070866 RepID=A0ABP8VF31_9PSEU